MCAALRSADDEMTIKCAYHRNCRILDNDNYKEKTSTAAKIESYSKPCNALSGNRLSYIIYIDTGLL